MGEVLSGRVKKKNLKSGVKRDGSFISPSDYLDPHYVELLTKLQEMCKKPTEEAKVISYLGQRFSESESRAILEVICNPGINEYQIRNKLNLHASTLRKIIRKHTKMNDFYAGYVPRGIGGKTRPLTPSELIITLVWEIIQYYKTKGPGLGLSGLGYLELSNPTRILLVKQKKDPSAGLWIFPGGYFNPSKGDESLRNTVRRRFREICRVEVAVEDEIRVFKPFLFGVPTESHIFQCRIMNGKRIEEGNVSDDSVSEARLWNPDEALGSEEVRSREKEFLKNKFRDKMVFPQV